MTTMTHTRTSGQIIAADLHPDEPARYIVRKAAVDPTPPKPPRELTWRDAISLDIRGEAAFTSPCVDCGMDVTVYPQDLERDEDTTEVDWTPVCVEDAEIRETWVALREQQTHEMARRRSMVGA